MSAPRHYLHIEKKSNRIIKSNSNFLVRNETFSEPAPNICLMSARIKVFFPDPDGP
jgi:hypothetical protein